MSQNMTNLGRAVSQVSFVNGEDIELNCMTWKVGSELSGSDLE